MLKQILVSLAALALVAGATAQVHSRTEVVSEGRRFEIKKVLLAEGTTALIFVQDSSTMEQQFVEDLAKSLPDDEKIALRVVRLKNLDAPAAKQYEVTATPTAIVYDRFARVLAKTSQADEIRAAVRKGTLMGRIKWIDEDDPKAAEFYGYPASGIKRGIPGIIKTMSLRKDAYQMFNIMSQIHFSNGFLTRREHEIVAAYVSALNKCKF